MSNKKNKRIVYISEDVKGKNKEMGEFQRNIWKECGISDVKRIEFTTTKQFSRDLAEALPFAGVIVPTGDESLYLLTDYADIGIHKARGSSFQYESIPVIPTVHSNYYLRGQLSESAQLFADWKKIARELKSPGSSAPNEKHNSVSACPKALQEYAEFICDLGNTGELSIDIEYNPEARQIICVGFACGPDHSFTVDLRGNPDLIKGVKQICQHSDIPKIFQGGLHDAELLWYLWNIKLKNYQWDTMYMGHSIDPSSKVGLEYLCSRYLEKYRAWKHNRYKGIDWLLQSNGLDCTYTWELCQALKPLINKDFYNKHYHDMIEPLTEISVLGIQQDLALKRDIYVKIDLQKHIDAVIKLTGGDERMFVTKDFSGDRLREYFQSKIPHGLGIGKKALEQNIANGLEVELCQAILAFREGKVVQDALKSETINSEGRVRWRYQPTAKTGRLRISGATAIQKNLRNVYVPDDGHIFCEMDYNGAEDRVIKAYSGTPVDKACDPYDSAQGVRSEMKKVALAAQRGDTSKASKEYLKAHPEITTEFFPFVRQTAWNHREATNSFGRKLPIPYEQFTDKLYRQLYAFYGQSEIADLINIHGIIPIHKFLSGRKSRILGQLCDAILFSLHPAEVFDVVTFAKACMETPLTIRSSEVVIPVDITLSPCWSVDTTKKKYKFNFNDEIPAKGVLNGIVSDILTNCKRCSKVIINDF